MTMKAGDVDLFPVPLAVWLEDRNIVAVAMGGGRAHRRRLFKHRPTNSGYIYHTSDGLILLLRPILACIKEIIRLGSIRVL